MTNVKEIDIHLDRDSETAHRAAELARRLVDALQLGESRLHAPSGRLSPVLQQGIRGGPCPCRTSSPTRRSQRRTRTRSIKGACCFTNDPVGVDVALSPGRTGRGRGDARSHSARVHQIEHEDPTFPKPAAELATGRVWSAGRRKVGPGDRPRDSGAIVNIVAAFLAKTMEWGPSGLNLEGAFPEFVTPPELPYSMDLPIGFIASLEPDEATRAFCVTIETGCIRDGMVSVSASGELLFSRFALGDCVEGAPLYVFQTVTQTVTFTETGAHVVAIFDEGGEALAAVPFGVRVLAEAAGSL